MAETMTVQAARPPLDVVTDVLNERMHDRPTDGAVIDCVSRLIDPDVDPHQRGIRFNQLIHIRKLSEAERATIGENAEHPERASDKELGRLALDWLDKLGAGPEAHVAAAYDGHYPSVDIDDVTVI